MPPQPEMILIVDDERPDEALMAYILVTEGYRVLLASNYYEALQKAGEHRDSLRLLITDVTLPDHDGFQLAQSVSDLTGGEAGVLFVSGYTGSEALPYHGLSTRDSHFLPKPFSRADLLRRVRYLLAAQSVCAWPEKNAEVELLRAS